MPFRLPSDLPFEPGLGLRIYEGVVSREWIDRNGHMNLVYHRFVFDQATQRLLRRIGLWDDDNPHGTTFALEDHVTYRRELLPGQTFFVTYQLLDHSEKLTHAFLRLFADPEADGDPPQLAAVLEQLGCYVDRRTRRSAPMPPAFSALLEKITERQAGLPDPPERGRVIGIRRRSPVVSVPA